MMMMMDDKLEIHGEIDLELEDVKRRDVRKAFSFGLFMCRCNSFLIDDLSSRPPCFDLPRRQWSTDPVPHSSD